MTTAAALGERVLRRLGVAVVPVASRPSLSTTTTVTVIGNDALIELGVIASDETAASADTTLATSKANSVHDALVSQGVVSWASTAIPQYVAEEYRKLTAIVMASSFGKQADPAQWPVIEARIRKATLIQRAPDLATEAVTAVHADLVASGQARWTLADIPLAAEQPYVLLAAFKLAPEFSVQPQPADVSLAEKALARLISVPSSGERTMALYF